MCPLHIGKFRKNLGILVLAFHLNRIRVRDGGLSPSWSLVQGNSLVLVSPGIYPRF